MENNLQQHWERVYQTKSPAEVSWTQEVPATSLSIIHSLELPRSARIIDVGGGDSKLVDFLLDEGYEHITVLDISASALDRAKRRLGERAAKVNWVVSDVLDFKPDHTYDLWHDRAAFHFLTTKEQVDRYLDIARKAVNGYLIIATFSEKGPTKCSGLNISQYTEESLSGSLEHGFKKLRCVSEDHITPFQTTQHFLFCSFSKLLPST